MAHVLAKLRNVKIHDIKDVLLSDASRHAEQGLYLEQLWQNADDHDEVLFLFKSNDLAHARQFIEKEHAQALQKDPKANIPQMTFLEER